MHSRNAKFVSLPLLLVSALLLAPLLLVLGGDIRDTLARKVALAREAVATKTIVAQHNALSAIHSMRETLVECTADFAVNDARHLYK